MLINLRDFEISECRLIYSCYDELIIDSNFYEFPQVSGGSINAEIEIFKVKDCFFE
jgi:hypothetical protein